MLKKKQKVVVQWSDAAVFSPGQQSVGLSPMKTVGMLESDLPDYLLIKNPVTVRMADRTKHPGGKKPTFYLIPKGMIRSVKPLKR